MRNWEATKKRLHVWIQIKTLSAYDIKGEKKTSNKSKKKEKAQDSHFRIYKCSKLFCTSTFERA